MKCFVHQTADAVGLCRNCSRGVCAECASDRPSGIACKGRCEAAVDGMDALVRRNVSVGSRVTSVHWVQLVTYAGFAVMAAVLAVFLIVRGDAEDYPAVAAMSVGALFMGVCAANLFKWMRSVRSTGD